MDGESEGVRAEPLHIYSADGDPADARAGEAARPTLIHKRKRHSKQTRVLEIPYPTHVVD